MFDQLKLAYTDDEQFLEAQITHMQMKALNVGYDLDWNLYEKTFGWYSVKKDLTEQERTQVESLWNSVYRKTIQPLRDEMGEEKFQAQLNINLMKPPFGGY